MHLFQNYMIGMEPFGNISINIAFMAVVKARHKLRSNPSLLVFVCVGTVAL